MYIQTHTHTGADMSIPRNTHINRKAKNSVDPSHQLSHYFNDSFVLRCSAFTWVHQTDITFKSQMDERGQSFILYYNVIVIVCNCISSAFSLLSCLNCCFCFTDSVSTVLTVCYGISTFTSFTTSFFIINITETQQVPTILTLRHCFRARALSPASGGRTPLPVYSKPRDFWEKERLVKSSGAGCAQAQSRHSTLYSVRGGGSTAEVNET